MAPAALGAGRIGDRETTPPPSISSRQSYPPHPHKLRNGIGPPSPVTPRTAGKDTPAPENSTLHGERAGHLGPLAMPPGGAAAPRLAHSFEDRELDAYLSGLNGKTAYVPPQGSAGAFNSKVALGRYR